MFNWLTRFFKKEEVSPQTGKLEEVSPSAYPKGLYTHYWEVIPGWSPELKEQTATVRFYSYTRGFENSFVFHNKDWNVIQEQINSLIHTQMKDFKR